MSADINAFVDKLVADAENKIRTDLKNVSMQVKADFLQKANEVVSLYYSNYKPKLYIRTYNLQNNVIDDDISFSLLNNNGYGAFIQFNSSGMSNYSKGNKDIVVSNFMHGIHGRESVAVDSNPAIDLMNDFQWHYKTVLDGYFMNLGYTIK